MFFPPILIAGPARCGSSLVAGFLHHHGVWAGASAQSGYENREISGFLKSFRGKDEMPEFRERVLSISEASSPWLVKSVGNLTKCSFWLRYFPEALWVLPWRPTEEIVESSMKHPTLQKVGREERERIAKWHQSIQARLYHSANYSMYVSTGALAKKSPREANNLLTFCNIDTDTSDLWGNVIRPELYYGEHS